MTTLKLRGYIAVKHVTDGMFEWWRHGLPTEPASQGKPLPDPKSDSAHEQSTVESYNETL